MSTTTFAELRAQIEARMSAIAAHVGIATTTEAINQVWFVIAILQDPDTVAQMRLGNSAEQTLEREQYLAWVAETFAAEVEQYTQLSEAAIREFVQKTGLGGFTETGVMQYLTAVDRVFRRGNGN